MVRSYRFKTKKYFLLVARNGLVASYWWSQLSLLAYYWTTASHWLLAYCIAKAFYWLKSERRLLIGCRIATGRIWLVDTLTALSPSSQHNDGFSLVVALLLAASHWSTDSQRRALPARTAAIGWGDEQQQEWRPLIGRHIHSAVSDWSPHSQRRLLPPRTTTASHWLAHC